MDAGRIVLVGRADEHAALLHVLDAVRSGLSGAVVLRAKPASARALLVWKTPQEGGFVSYLGPGMLGEAHGLVSDEADALEVVESVARSLSGRD